MNRVSQKSVIISDIAEMVLLPANGEPFSELVVIRPNGVNADNAAAIKIFMFNGTGALDASALGALESGAALASTSLCTSFSF